MGFLAVLTVDMTDPAAVRALVPAELARVQVLKAEGKIVRLVLTEDRLRGFIELASATRAEAESVLASLPLHPYMKVDLLGPLASPL